tara:strand:- start:82 stop:531 length:450 start_codon:yes stop_codon:yes gene_type:complete
MTLSSRELGLLSNTDVLGYIQAQNAARNAQAKAEGWDFWTLMSETLAEEYANVYEMELCFARNAYSDTHKSWVGVRSSVSEELTLEQVEAEVAKMAACAEAAWIADQEYLAMMDAQHREEIAMGLTEPAPETELEEWEVYEAKAEAEGY